MAVMRCMHVVPSCGPQLLHVVCAAGCVADVFVCHLLAGVLLYSQIPIVVLSGLRHALL
jgi:hypothetical protein